MDYNETDGRRNGNGTTAGSSNNILLIGVTGSGKTSVGWLLAHLIGYGFLDTDQFIEQQAGKSVADIFAESGEDEFRKVERQSVHALGGLRTHVIATGGGAVVDPETWGMLTQLGSTVWINTPAEEVAKRLNMKPDALRSRPLIADLVNVPDKAQRLKQLTDRIGALIAQRKDRFQEAKLVMNTAHSTLETSAHLLKSLLVSEGILK